MATQKGRNWSSGDIVTAANLSSIERGVSAVAEEYTPTTWANGNTVTAAALNNIEQGIANAGGGGSSDFSTAQVTVVDSDTGYVSDRYMMSFITEDDGVVTQFVNAEDESRDLIVPLYKEKVAFAASENIVVSGDATYDEDIHVVHIFGNCTIKGYLRH